MTNKTLILIAKKNDIWIDIVKTFGLTQTEAEDVVQDMYIKIQIKLESGTNIMYGEEINYYYIYKSLKSVAFDFIRKQDKIITISLDDPQNLLEYYYKDKFTAPKSVNYDEAYSIVCLFLSFFGPFFGPFFGSFFSLGYSQLQPIDILDSSGIKNFWQW